MERRDFVRITAVAGTGLAAHPAWPRSLPAGLLPVPSRTDFNPGWRFLLGESEGAERGAFDDSAWSAATLPHTARIESLVTGEPGSDTWQWQGTCWYRKRFFVSRESAGRKLFLKFDGAMNVADVWLNGDYLGRHMGGWLPFGFDISSRVVAGEENLLAVRLDNRDNPVTGPKPLPQLDFNPYHGMYRSVHLITKDPLHITDPILADKPASGGVFVTYPDVSAEAATVRAQVHVRNDGAAPREFRVRARLFDGERIAAEVFSETIRLGSGQHGEVLQDLRVLSPALWSPRRPDLYVLHTEVIEDGIVVDEEATRIGIRRIEISAEGFRINGERLFLRGTNRHQEYPYVGYALSDAAQYRDARKIKDAGFDYVRLSHYAHAPAFMDACDELGLVVMDCIPGWQFFNREDPEFTRIQVENCRRLLRRDRNHPCVILWEVSLNETDMPEEFIRRTHAIGHEEIPGDQTYTCGWTEGYDVFIQARQHGGCRDVTDRSCVISEYGDWEYYAQNAGLEQEAWAGLAPDDANSRQLRWHGEAALLQQAANFQEAHNDNLKTIAFADGLWVMFDYNRGYAPDIESSGCMDLFRLPKLSLPFFHVTRWRWSSTATWWDGGSPTRIGSRRMWRIHRSRSDSIASDRGPWRPSDSSVDERRSGTWSGRREPPAAWICGWTRAAGRSRWTARTWPSCGPSCGTPSEPPSPTRGRTCGSGPPATSRWWARIRSRPRRASPASWYKRRPGGPGVRSTRCAWSGRGSAFGF
jgi:beta-galactosidase